MKTIFKRGLAVLLTVLMLLGVAPVNGFDFAVSAAETTYKTGDIIEFGSYPQSKVTDEGTISQLDAITKNWISYGYYSGTGDYDDGNMTPSDYMKYCDITLNGNKYRAVTFSAYRPYCTGYEHDDGTYQDDNGYYIDNVYYFKYEPLKWVVLDASTGLVVCDSVIDSQAYNNYILYSSSDCKYYGDSTKSHYASDWEHSSLRAWLNDDFLNTAFTSSQQSNIKTVTRENKSTDSSTYDSNPTSDKITLLSYWDVLNTSYGFSSLYNAYGTARYRKSTDYTKCQGCHTSSYHYGNSYWWLRSAYNSDIATGVHYDGWAHDDNDVGFTSYGVVPAFNFTNLSDIQSSFGNEHNHSLKHIIEVSTCKKTGKEYDICTDCGETFSETTLPLADHTWGEWKTITEPTATTVGMEKRTCLVCGAEETAIIENVTAVIYSVAINDLTMDYKSSKTLKPVITADDGAEYTITYSSDNKNVTIDENGKLYAAKRGTANITVTVTDSQGNIVTDTCKVTVEYTWWQWLIKIVLFGWIWY